MEWSIQQVAQLTGTTSRTLRHYDDLGIVPPSRVGSNGYRYYDEAALMRLQRVLLLRELGLGLPRIAEVLERRTDEASALATHLALLHQERERLARQIAAVEHTMAAARGEEKLMAGTMFDGFDHTEHREEVERRWGKDAYTKSDSWWRSLGQQEQREFKEHAAQLIDDWIAAAKDPQIRPDSDAAQQLARRHVEWLASSPGPLSGYRSGIAPADQGGAGSGSGSSSGSLSLPEQIEYLRGLGDMYVADERFARTYGGPESAAFVRDALAVYTQNLEQD